MDREQKIRERAYELWVEDGRPDGREGEHWSRAAVELGYDDAPASDSHELPEADDAGQKASGGPSPAMIPPPD